jgi:hypothetical protein
MSNELIRRSLCDESPEYHRLTASLVTVETLLVCNAEGKLVKNTGVQILEKLFLSGNDGCDPKQWFDVKDSTCKKCGCLKFYSCFDERYLYYYDKKCKIRCKPWVPKKSKCMKKTLKMVVAKYPEYPQPIKTFKDIADALTLYIAHGLCTESWEDILAAIKALCEVVNQRVYFDMGLKKQLVTLNPCTI